MKSAIFLAAFCLFVLLGGLAHANQQVFACAPIVAVTDEIPAELLELPDYLVRRGARVEFYREGVKAYWRYLTDAERSPTTATFQFPYRKFTPLVVDDALPLNFDKSDSQTMIRRLGQSQPRPWFDWIAAMTGQTAPSYRFKPPRRSEISTSKALKRYRRRRHVYNAEVVPWVEKTINALPDQTLGSFQELTTSLYGEYWAGLLGKDERLLEHVVSFSPLNDVDFVAWSVMPVFLYSSNYGTQMADGLPKSPKYFIEHDESHTGQSRLWWKKYFSLKNLGDLTPQQLKMAVIKRHQHFMKLDVWLSSIANQPHAETIENQILLSQYNQYHEGEIISHESPEQIIKRFSILLR